MCIFITKCKIASFSPFMFQSFQMDITNIIGYCVKIVLPTIVCSPVYFWAYSFSAIQNYWCWLRYFGTPQLCSDFHVNKTVLKLYNQITKVHDGIFTLNATNSIIKNDVFCILVKGSSISYQKLMICKGVFYFVLLLFFFWKEEKLPPH